MLKVYKKPNLLFRLSILLTFAVLILQFSTINAQNKNCSRGEVLKDDKCVCAPGYFFYNPAQKCDHLCQEVDFSFFNYGTCVKTGQHESQCNHRCSVQFRLWTLIGILCVFAASIATLIFTLPMCIATCVSCFHSKKASKHSKNVYAEQQNPNKEPQLQTLSYNPYAYWPYYGRAC